mgnify:CR=1 FL=1
MKKLLREPLLHFFVAGACLFALFAWQSEDALQAPDDIIVDTMRVETLKTQFERVWQRSPTPDELQNLVESWVREEILYREGVALGLDRNDPVLRRRVAQNMEFIAEQFVEPLSGDDELEEWFARNADDYRIDPRFSFRQVYLDPSARSAAFEARVEEANQVLASGDIPASDVTLLPVELEDVALAEVRRTFGDAFAESLPGIAVGEWAGPVASGYGLHFVLVDWMQPSRVPELDEVRDAVERDYLAERTRALKDRFYETLRERYNVVYEDSLAMARATSGTERVQ